MKLSWYLSGGKKASAVGWLSSNQVSGVQCKLHEDRTTTWFAITTPEQHGTEYNSVMCVTKKESASLSKMMRRECYL